MPNGKPSMKGYGVKDVDAYEVTLYRYAGEDQVTGHYMGYEVIRQVAVEKSLILRARNEKQLAAMINVASIDGWRVK